MSDCLTEDERRELLMLAGRMGEILAPDIQPNMDELRQVRARARRQRLHARQLCDELLRVDPKVREEEARRYKKYHTPAVIDLLLKRSQAEVLNDPKVSRQLAELALAIADAMYPSPTVPHPILRDRFALGHAQVGNVCRLLCDWSEAHRRFRKARELLLDGAGDLEIHAHIHHLYGALLKDLRQFPLALKYLELARVDYHALGQDHEAGLVLLTTAVMYRNMSAPDRALQVHTQACESLDENRAPEMVAAAWKNLALYFCDLGRYEDAATLLENLPTVFERLPPESSIHLNLTWVHGMVAHGLGNLARAEECYLSVRAGYDRCGDLYSAACVSLDLLRAYFDNGRLLEVERFAESVYRAIEKQPLATDAQEVFRILTAARAQRHLVENALGRLAAILAQNPHPAKRSPATEP